MAIRRRGLGLLASLAVPAAAQAQMQTHAQTQAQTLWPMTLVWPENNLHTRNLRQFAEDVRQATQGALQIDLQAGNGMATLAEHRAGLRSGRLQIGELVPAAETESDPLVMADSLPLLVRGFDEARRLARLTRPALEQSLREQDLTLLYSAPWPPAGLFSGFALESLASLDGTRMRVLTPLSARLATLIGATAIRGEPQAAPGAVRIATIMFASAARGVDIEAWSFARFFTPLNLTYMRNAVCVRTVAFEALAPSNRAAVRVAAVAAEDRGWVLAAASQVRMLPELAAHGIVTRPPTAALLADLQRPAQTMRQEWLARSGIPGQKLLEALRGN